MTAQELLDVARWLADFRQDGATSSVAIRRSISTSYYAVFHAICRLCADEMVGEDASPDWDRVYRSLDHGKTKSELLSFAKETEDAGLGRIAGTFGNLLLDRHAADYDPRTTFSGQEADSWVLFAAEAVGELARLDLSLRRRLAVRLVLGTRRGRT